VQQRQFVEAILDNKHHNVPFMLFGPFGTGKSRTIIELAQQIVMLNGKVLLCTQSNSAADLLMERLKSKFTPKDLFRLYAFHRRIDSISPSMLEYTVYREGIYIINNSKPYR
jgi:helicase MOV-10